MKKTKGNDFETTATAEERVLARALESRPVPAMPEGTIEGIERRLRVRRAAVRARFIHALWVSAAAVAAAVALLVGTWGLRPGGAAPELVAEATEADPFAEAEAEWLSPYDAEFEELETTLLAFEALDFDSDATAFPSL